MSSKKRAHIVSSFKDSGTGENFIAGTTPLIDAGAYANYEAAGLVKAPPPAKAAAKPKQKPKSKSKPAAKAATSAPAAPAVPAEIPAPDAN